MHVIWFLPKNVLYEYHALLHLQSDANIEKPEDMVLLEEKDIFDEGIVLAKGGSRRSI